MDIKFLIILAIVIFLSWEVYKKLTELQEDLVSLKKYNHIDEQQRIENDRKQQEYDYYLSQQKILRNNQYDWDINAEKPQEQTDIQINEENKQLNYIDLENPVTYEDQLI